MEKIRSTNGLKVYVGGEVVNEWGAFKRNKGDIKNEFLDHEGQHYILIKNLKGFYNYEILNYKDYIK